MQNLKLSKRALAFFLCGALAVSMMPFAAAQAKENGNEDYPYVVYTGDSGNSLDFCKSNLTVNGNIHSNGKLAINAGNVNINGECGAVEGIDKGQGNFNVQRVDSAAKIVSMVSISDKIKTAYFTNNCDQFKDSYVQKDINVNLNRSAFSSSDIHLSGNIALNCSVGSTGNIVFDGNALNANNTVLYSENGNITINNDNANVNGLIYAPNGVVIVKGQNFDVNGAIIAKKVIIDSGTVNINHNGLISQIINYNPSSSSSSSSSSEDDGGTCECG